MIIILLNQFYVMPSYIFSTKMWGAVPPSPPGYRFTNFFFICPKLLITEMIS